MSPWSRESHGQYSWVASRSERPRSPRISICSYSRLRLEARVACHTWARQMGLSREDFEVVLAEFGEAPTVFPDDASRECLDCYIFGHMPAAAPAAAPWWRNVSVQQARAPYVLVVDGDIALSPLACAAVVEILSKRAGDRPVAAHPQRQLLGQQRVEPGASFEQIAAGAGERRTNESAWAFDAGAYRSMGGWCEAVTGNRWEAAFFDHRAAEIFDIAEPPRDFFCHVLHCPAPPDRMGSPLFAGAPNLAWLAHRKKRGEVYWPIDGWPVADPCLLEPGHVSLPVAGRTDRT